MQKQRIYRQGDVLLIKVRSRRKGAELAREKGRVVLAHGEVTGHAHAIDDKACALYVDDTTRAGGEDARTLISRLGGGLIADRVLLAREDVTLRHEEHDAIKLPKGTYVVRIQREYSPEELRNVAD